MTADASSGQRPVVERARLRTAHAMQEAWWALRSAPRCAAAAARSALSAHRYIRVSAAELRAARTSDTAFVFGSGSSLNDISAAEWSAIARCNTISFREFPRQRWIRADYHLTAEVDFLDEYAQRLRDNPLYAHTIFVVQAGWRAFNGNDLIGRGLLLPGARVFRFRRRSRGRVEPPSRSFDDGLVHGYNSVFDAINLAALVGFRDIVLAGVDLYDKRYFWLPPDRLRAYEKKSVALEEPFHAAAPIVDMAALWKRDLENRGVRLLVYNPRSLLAGALAVFDRAQLRLRVTG